MLSAKFRKYSDSIMLPLGGIVAKSGITPNVLTLIGLLLSALAGLAFAYGLILYAFIFMALSSFFDILDGAVAKASGLVTELGGFLDSVADRYSDAFILIGIAVYMGGHYVLVMVVIVGSLLVSYTRARAEKIIDNCDVGLAERSERLIVLMVAALLESIMGVNLFYEALVFLAIITHLTVIWRVWYTSCEV